MAGSLSWFFPFPQCPVIRWWWSVADGIMAAPAIHVPRGVRQRPGSGDEGIAGVVVSGMLWKARYSTHGVVGQWSSVGTRGFHLQAPNSSPHPQRLVSILAGQSPSGLLLAPFGGNRIPGALSAFLFKPQHQTPTPR